jgi:cytochrome c biogenesis protein CcmG, thiol:disulfide interchange protein DsbE
MTTATTLEPRDWRARVRESRLGTLAVLIVTAVLVMGAAYLIDGPKKSANPVTAVKLTGTVTGSGPVVGKPAQDFTATTVDGQQISLSAYRGHPVWLTFGASWCAACRAEAPDIEATYEHAKADGVVVLEVFISEDSAAVRGYAGRVGLSYVQVADPDTRISSAYRVLGIPAHYFIDRTGVLRLIKTGSLTRARMDAALAETSRYPGTSG